MRPAVRWCLLAVLIVGAFRWGTGSNQDEERVRRTDDAPRLDRNALDEVAMDATWPGWAEGADQPAVAWWGGRALVARIATDAEGLDALRLDLQSGETWERQSLSAPSQRLAQPTLAADAVALCAWVDLSGPWPTVWRALADAQGWGEPAAVTAVPSARQVSPAAAVSGATAVLVWQETVAAEEEASGRPTDQIRLAVGSRLLTVTASRESCHTPCVALSPDASEAWVAWVESTGVDLEVFAACVTLSSGEVSPPVAISCDDWSDDRHPSIAVDGAGRVWVAYDAVRDSRRGLSGDAPPVDPAAFDRREVKVAVLEERVVHVTEGDGACTDVPLCQSGGFPVLVADDGGVHVVFRSWFFTEGAFTRRYSYPLLWTTWTDGGWSTPRLFDGSDGEAAAGAIAANAGSLLVAWQRDERLAAKGGRGKVRIPEEVQPSYDRRGVFLNRFDGPSGIGVAQVAAPESAVRARDVALTVRSMPLREPRFHPWPDPTSDRSRGRARATLEHDEVTYQLYWGDLHRHSNVSRCSDGEEPSPVDRYLDARELLGCDFFALTDHANQTDPLQWERATRLVQLAHAPTFVVLQGFEWSSQHDGHVNVLLRGRSDEVFSSGRDEAGSLESLWSQFGAGEAITIPHHSAAASIGYDWAQHDGRRQRLVEVFQARRGSYEFQGCFRQARSAVEDGQFVHDALQAGHRLGIVASTDHGSGASYAAVYATELTREAVFDALRARRCYGATTRGMVLDLRVDGHLMGEVVRSVGAPRRVELRAQGTRELAEVVVFRNGEPWRRFSPDTTDAARRRPLLLELTVEGAGGATPTSWRLTVPDGAGRFAPADDRPMRRGDDAHPRPVWSRVTKHDVVYRQVTGLLPPRVEVDRRVRLVAPDETTVTLAVGEHDIREISVASLRTTPVEGTVGAMRWRLEARGKGDAAIDESQGLGTQAWSGSWLDETPHVGPGWYAARVIQVDGEMAWSSPIFIASAE